MDVRDPKLPASTRMPPLPGSALAARAAALCHDAALRPRWRLLLTVLVATISWLAFSPSHQLPHLPTADKTHHVLAFATLAVVALLAMTPGRQRAAGAALALVAYGGFIEAVQSALPTRSAEWGDVLADVVGIAVGLVLVAAARRATAAWATALRQ